MNALITNSMLALYASKQNKTYLQMIEPFILYSIPNHINKKIDIAYVEEKVYREFGLDIKSKVVERILLNLSKIKKNRITSKKDKNKFIFSLTAPIDNTEFDNNRQRMKDLVSEVVRLLKDYLNEKNFLKITDKQAEDMLINYLDEYNFNTYKSIDSVEQIQIEENIGSDHYKVAKFIFNEYKNDKVCFQKILTIQEGYFAVKALYNFFESNNKDDNVKNTLNDTCIVLDTMLLIDAYKWDTDYKARSMEELLKLIIENGGKLYTFDYYVEELCGILERYVNDYDSRIYLDLDYFRKNNIDSSTIIKEEYNLERLLKSKKNLEPFKGVSIEILYLDSYEDIMNQTKWKIDKDNLEREIKAKIRYSNPVSLENDCNTIRIILHEKITKGKKLIFMSSNNSLISVAKHSTDTKNRNAFYTDIDLASMIWLSNYNAKTKLSECTLLQNAYAALLPSKEFVKEVVNDIEKNIGSTDEQLKQEALLLRYDKDLLARIGKVYQNDRNNLKLKTHEDLMNQLRIDISSELKSDAELKVKKEHSNEKKRLKKEEYETTQQKRANNAKERTLNKREEKIKKDMQYIEQIQEKMDEQGKEVESMKNTLKLIREIQKHKYKKCSLFIGKMINIFLSLLCGGGFFILFGSWIYFTLDNLIPNDLHNNIYLISGLISLLFTAIPFILFYKKFVMKISMRAEEYIYQFLCKRSVILNFKND